MERHGCGPSRTNGQQCSPDDGTPDAVGGVGIQPISHLRIMPVRSFVGRKLNDRHLPTVFGRRFRTQACDGG